MPNKHPQNIEAPLVSVIMPAYNHAHYVREALLSVVAQTYPNIELIVIDDGSEDDTPLIIQETLDKIERKMHVVFARQKNAGICVTLNRGLNLASGSYVQFLASDDAYLPEKTARSVAAFSAAGTRVAGVYCDGYIIDEKSQRRDIFSNKYRVPLGQNTHRELLVANWIPAMGILYRRDTLISLGGFDPNLKFEDWDLLLRLTRNYDIERIPDKLFHYRFHTNNMTWNTSLMEDTTRAIADKHRDMSAYLELKSDMRKNGVLAIFRHREHLDLALRSLSRKVFTNRGIQGQGRADAVQELCKLILGDCITWLRTAYHRLAGVHLGPGSCVKGRLKVRGNRNNLRIGPGVVFEGNVEFILPIGYGIGSVSIRDNCTIASGVVFHCIAGHLELGACSNIGHNVILQSKGDLLIGEGTVIAANAGIYASGGLKSEADLQFSTRETSFIGISIGAHCRLGHSSIVVDGATLGRNSIVEPNIIVSGIHGPNTRLRVQNRL